MNLILIILLYLNNFAAYFGSWLPAIGGFPTGGILRDITILVVCLLTILHIFKNSLIRKDELVLFGLWTFYILFLFVLIVFDDQKIVAILGARNLIFFPFVGFVLLYNIFRGYLDVEKIRKHLICIAFISASLGIMDVVTQGEFILKLGYRPDYGNFKNSLITNILGFQRASGGLADSLVYGYLMAFYAIYLVFLIFGKKDFEWLPFKYITLILSALSCVLSLTRGAIIVLFVGILSQMVIIKKKYIIYFAILSFIVVMIFMSFNAYTEVLFGRFMQTDQGVSEESSNMRIEMVIDSIQYLKQNPCGVGLGTQAAGANYTKEDMRINTDNYFLLLALESGIIGFFIFVFIIICNFCMILKYIKSSKFESMFFYNCFITLIISGNLSSVPVHPVFAVIFWTITNMEIADVQRKKLV